MASLQVPAGRPASWRSFGMQLDQLCNGGFFVARRSAATVDPAYQHRRGDLELGGVDGRARGSRWAARRDGYSSPACHPTIEQIPASRGSRPQISQFSSSPACAAPAEGISDHADDPASQSFDHREVEHEPVVADIDQIHEITAHLLDMSLVHECGSTKSCHGDPAR